MENIKCITGGADDWTRELERNFLICGKYLLLEEGGRSVQLFVDVNIRGKENITKPKVADNGG